jgi:hypothetical protein
MKETRLEKLQYHFKHFSLRLAERYNIFITFEEYVDLCNLPRIYDEIYIKRPDGRTCFKGYIKIKGNKINVYRQSTRPRALLTALT